MPFLENLEKTAKEKPTEVRLFLLKFGGKLEAKDTEATYKRKGRGSAPGYMEMVEITNEYPDELEKLTEFFRDRAKQFLAKGKK